MFTKIGCKVLELDCSCLVATASCF